MSSPQHNSSRPSLLRFRRDLRCSLHDNEGTLYYLVEDPARGSFYRLGLREWKLASQFDGNTSLADAVGELTDGNDASDMSPTEAETVARFLLTERLAEPVGPDGQVCHDVAKLAARTEPPTKLNPFFMRFPLIYPDDVLATVLPWCRWMLGRQFFLIWTTVVVWGGYCIVSQWHRFTDSSLVYFSPHTWVYLWLVWCLLKIIHESFHGLFCKKYGGYVGSAGIALILFSPIAFVDVTSAWRFRSKWQRIGTSAAGIYVELLIAGIAAIVWSHVDNGTVGHICHSIVLTASVTTVLFNANPLMRFDGYYMLSDLLGIQNLYGAGQQFVRGSFRRLFLGLPTSITSQQYRDRRWIVNTYGIAAAMWRILVCASLVLLAATLFHGAGLVVALMGVVSWVALPFLRFAKFLVVGQPNQQPSRLRFAVMSTISCLTVLIVFWLPWPGGVAAPAVVAYTPEEIVRAATTGFVQTVHVTAGQHVHKHETLVTLSNDELRAELADAELAVQQSTIRTRILHRDDNMAAYQAEQEKLGAQRKRYAHLQSRVDGLNVRAPMDGYVLGRRGQDLVGKFVDVGAPLMRVVDESRKEIQVSIPETYVKVFSQNVGAAPNVKALGRTGKVRAGQLTKVEPRASATLPNAALGTIYGGPLTVREVRSDWTESNSLGSRFELTTPRFRGVIALPADEALRLRSGQLALVRIRDSNETLGRRAYRTAKAWIQRKLNQRLTAET